MAHHGTGFIRRRLAAEIIVADFDRRQTDAIGAFDIEKPSRAALTAAASNSFHRSELNGLALRLR
jgi:hypothetical protein